MARVKLDLPDTFEFSTEIPVRIGDINYGNHLGNDAVLSLVHEARVRFFAAHGFTELDIDGCGVIMTDAVVIYKSEAHYGDILTIDVGAQDWHRSGLDIVYRLSNREAGKEAARAKTGILFFNYARKKVVRIPERFKAEMGK